MDAGGLGAILGITSMVIIGIGVCVYDRFYKNKNEITSSTPLKKMFNHV